MPRLNTIASARTLLGASAALVFALGASAAYAQDAMTKKEMSDAVMESAEDTMDAAEETMDAAEELQEDVMNAPDTTMEPVMVDKTNMMKDDSMMKKGAMKEGAMMDGAMMDGRVKGSFETTPATTPATTIACPSGTTAQPDGTCMVTGNWNGE